MTHKKISRFQLFVQKIAASPAGSRVLSLFMHHLDRACLKASRGRTSVTEIFAGMPMVLLTTTGARSGKRRALPVLCLRDAGSPGTLSVTAANWGRQKMPAWYYNLKANPRALALLDGSEDAYSAHEASGAEYEHYWAIAIDTFVGLPQYKQRVGQRAIPIMVLSPEPGDSM